MNTPILDRLNARIAAEPSLTELDTLFVDLQDARDAIVAQVAENTDLKDRLSAPPVTPPPAQPSAPAESGTVSENVTEALVFLRTAKERLAVNSPSSAGDNIDSAMKLLA